MAATVVLASTTAVPQLITGFERLRVPRALTAIGAFMIRYLDVVTGELQRMRVARESRGDRARWLWQAKAVGAGAGALFVRSHERGERVFLAMESRGYTGTLPSVRCGDELDARVADALSAVGMSRHRDRAPHHLSFGERRRVALATVLAMQPDVLVLDEPSANLDPASRRELVEILLTLEITLVMVTHDLPYALQLCPRSVVLDSGMAAADGVDAARRV